MFGIEGVTASAVELALDAAVLRDFVISNNLANVRTEGYSPRRLTSEDQLRSAGVGVWRDESDDVVRSRLASVRDELASPASMRTVGHDAVEIDTEMVHLADNTVRYKALLEGLAKSGAIVRAAVTEGRS